MILLKKQLIYISTHMDYHFLDIDCFQIKQYDHNLNIKVWSQQENQNNSLSKSQTIEVSATRTFVVSATIAVF